MRGKEATLWKGVRVEQQDTGRDKLPTRLAGDDRAYGDLSDRAFVARVTPHLPALVRVTAALVGQADAEDAAQEAIVRAWQALASLRDVEAFRSWLLRIAVNVCRDWHRGRFGTAQRLSAPLDGVADDESFAAIAADPGTSDHTGALDMRRAVNALDRDLRVVVLLRYYAELDATAIGAMLGLPSATVRTRLRRALALLRETLSGPIGDAPSVNTERSR